MSFICYLAIGYAVIFTAMVLLWINSKREEKKYPPAEREPRYWDSMHVAYKDRDYVEVDYPELQEAQEN